MSGWEIFLLTDLGVCVKRFESFSEVSIYTQLSKYTGNQRKEKRKRVCEKRRHEKNGEDGLPVTLILTHDLSCVSPPLFQLQGKKKKEKKEKQHANLSK